MNQFGSERRMAMALGVERLDEIAERIHGLMNVKAPEGLLDKLKMLPQLARAGKCFPKKVSAKDAPCKEVIRRESFDLIDFPILQCWPHDGGRFITLPCVHTRDPRDGQAQHRHVSHAGVRRADDGHALAAAEGGGGALPQALRARLRHASAEKPRQRAWQ